MPNSAVTGPHHFTKKMEGFSHMGCCVCEHYDYEDVGGGGGDDYDFDANPTYTFKQDQPLPPPPPSKAEDINIEAGFERCHQCKTIVFLKRDPGQRYCGDVCRYWAKKKRQGKYDKLKNQ